MEAVQVTGFESEGVALISPLAASFDSKIEALSAPDMAEVVKYAKPYVVIVSNKTARTIVAHTISSNVPSGFGGSFSWTFDGEDEPAPEHIENQMFMAADAVGATSLDFGDRSARGILPGEERLVGLGFEIPVIKPRFDQLPEGWDDDRVWNWGVSTTGEIIERIKGLAAEIEAIKILKDPFLIHRE